MKFLAALHSLFLALTCLVSVEFVNGAAYLCGPDGPCQEDHAGTCAEFFEAHFVWPNGDSACCSFKEIDGNCTITTTSSCQYDSKEKYSCTETDPETGDEVPCPMVGPTMFSASAATEDAECPPSDFEVPESSIMDMGGDEETDKGDMVSSDEVESAASFNGSSLLFALMTIASLALFQ